MYNLIFLLIASFPLFAMDIDGGERIQKQYVENTLKNEIFSYKIKKQNSICSGGEIQMRLLTYKEDFIGEGLIDTLVYNNNLTTMKSLLLTACMFASRNQCTLIGIYLPMNKSGSIEEKNILDYGFKKHVLWIHGNFEDPHYFYEKKLLNQNNIL